MSDFAKLRTDLVFSHTEIDGEKIVNIKDPRTDNYFRLREPEFWLISQLDGITSYNKISDKFKAKYNLNITTEAVGQFVELLEQNFFLENSRSEQLISRKSSTSTKSLLSKLLFIKFKAFNPAKILDFLVRLYKPFHTLPGFIFQIALILFGIALFISNYNSFIISVDEIFNVGSIITIIAAFFILITTHEFSHAMLCRFYGGQVKEMGFLLLYFQPCCYCDLSDVWLFKKKSQRIAVTLAGLYSGFILFALTMIIWRMTIPGSVINETAGILVIILIITFIFNLNPLIKLDGYYVLSDIFDISNLRSKSFSYLSNIFKRHILGWPIEKITVTLRQKRIYIAYSIFSSIYTILLIGYLLIITYRFLYLKSGAAGILLLSVVILFTLRQNITNFCKAVIQHFKYLKDIMKRPLRLISYLVFLIVFIVLFFVIKFPHRVTGEITIAPIAEFSLLLNDFGLLEKKYKRGGEDSEVKSSFLQMTSTDLASLDLVLFVKDGQKVAFGDTLAILMSNQVKQELRAAQSVMEKLQNDLALLKSPPKREEIEQAQSEVNAAEAVYNQKLRESGRLKELLNKKLTSKEEYELSESEVRIAKAEVENKQAQIKLLKSPPKAEEEAVYISEIEKQKSKIDFLITQQDAQSIISPIEGRVVINPDEEDFLTINDNQQIEILIPVSDFDISLVWLNQEVKVKVRSYTEEIFTGEIVHVPQDATVSENNSYFKVSAVLENQSDKLHKGMTGYAKIEVGKINLFELLLRRIKAIIRVEFWSWW